MESTAKGSAHPLTTQSQRLLFCMLRHHRRHLIEACIFSRLGCTGSLCTLRERQFLLCFISGLGNEARFTQQLGEKQRSSSSCVWI